MLKKIVTNSIFNISSTICFFIVGGLITVNSLNLNNEYAIKYSVNEKAIKDLNEEILLKKSNDKSIEQKVNLVEADLYSAKKIGDLIAEYQNIYLRGDISFDEKLDLITKNKSAFKDFFDSNSKSKAATWYMPSENTVKASWTFKTTYDFDDPIIPVLWICKSDKNELLAYATAEYNAVANIVKDVDYHISLIGSKYILGTE